MSRSWWSGTRPGTSSKGTVGEGTDRTDLSLPGVQGELVDAVHRHRHTDRRRAAQRPPVHARRRRAARGGDRRSVVPRPGRRSRHRGRAHRRPQPVGQADRLAFHEPPAPSRSSTTTSRWHADFRARTSSGSCSRSATDCRTRPSPTTDLVIDVDRGVGGRTDRRVASRLANTGERAGTEVVQLYVRGSGRQHHAAGARAEGLRTRRARARRRRARSRSTCRRTCWRSRASTLERIVEPGLIEVKVGASSADIRLEGTVERDRDARGSSARTVRCSARVSVR